MTLLGHALIEVPGIGSPALAPWIIVTLALTAFLTSAFSAVVGMGGGVVLLVTMLLFLDPLDAIPLHGAIQLISNSTRATVQRRHLAWNLVFRYSILLLPFGALSIMLVNDLPREHLTGCIGIFVILATWRPRWLLMGLRADRIDAERRFLLLGGLVGFLNILVGAVGPFISPFFLNMDLSRQAIVGTKAACQTCGHVVKILLFGLAGFAFLSFLPLLLVMFPMVITGTWAGSRLLEQLGDRSFTRLFKGVLTCVATWLIVKTLVGS